MPRQPATASEQESQASESAKPKSHPRLRVAKLAKRPAKEKVRWRHVQAQNTSSSAPHGLSDAAFVVTIATLGAIELALVGFYTAAVVWQPTIADVHGKNAFYAICVVLFVIAAVASPEVLVRFRRAAGKLL